MKEKTIKKFENIGFIVFCVLVFLTTIVGAMASGDLDLINVDIKNDDIYKELKLNDATNREAIISFKNPTNEIISRNDIKVNFVEDCGKVLDYKILKKDICTGERVKEYIYDTREICKEIPLNDTKGTEIKCYDETYLKETIYENYNYDCYNEFDKINANDLNDIKIKVDNIKWETCDDGTFGYKVDWQLETKIDDLSFVKKEWAWWNVSYDYKMEINCTNLDDYTPIVVNGSNGFEIDGEKQIVWTYCSGTGTAIYYNDYDDYVIANDTANIPFEVEFGNGTSYFPEDVWDDNFVVVHHLNELSGTTVEDSTEYHDATNTGASLNGNGIIGRCYNFTNGNYLTTDISGNTPDSYEGWIFSYYVGAEVNAWIWGSSTTQNQDDGRLNSGYHGFIVRDTNGGSVAGTGDAVPIGSWHYLVYTNAGSGATGAKIYVDGILDGEGTTTASTYEFDWFGRLKNGETNIYGAMDEIRISSVVRSPEFVNQTYQNVLGTSGYGDLGEIETEGTTPPEFMQISLIPSETSHCFSVEFKFNDTDDNIIQSYMDYSSGSCNQTTNESIGVLFYVDYLCCGIPNEMNIFNVTITDEADNTITTDNFNYTYPNNCPSFNPSLINLSSYINSTFLYDIDGIDTDSDTLYFYDNCSLFDINLTTGIINYTTDNISLIGNYSINITLSDGYCNVSDIFNYELSILPPEIISTSNIGLLDFDLSSLTNVFILFSLIILYLGTMFIAFSFKNFGFASFGFFIGLIIGLLFASLSII